MPRTRSFLYAAGLMFFAALVLLFLQSCNLPFFTPGDGEATEVVTTELPSDEGIDYAPGIGSLVAWIDQSYVVFVPGGEFDMGQDEESLTSDYEPAHTVSLDPFWIHQTEVTNRMYALCVAADVCEVPYHITGKPYWYTNNAHALDPVVGVSWNQAATYCEWIEGRLPTEAEWEKAARGTGGEPYPWGDEAPDCSLLNYDDCQEIDAPVRVRSFFDGASPFLLADTAGNVREWVQDWYEQDAYATSLAENPTGPASGTARVIRGSSYLSPLDELEIYTRSSADPDEHIADVGFRCVLSGETVGDPPPPVCEAIPYIPLPIEDHPLDFHPPEFVVSSFCMPDPTTGVSQGYVTLVFPEPIGPGILITSDAGALLSSISDDTWGLSGPGVPVDTFIEFTVCGPAPDLPVIEAACPPDYYFDEDTDTCRYGMETLHDTPDSCGTGELWIPGYGCLHACPVEVSCFCPIGFDAYGPYSGTTPLDYTLCLPPDGPEECLTDPLCSASNTCPEGFSYITESDCCELPPDVPAYCPPLYTIKLSEEHLCIPDDLEPLCTSFTVYIPNCDEPVIPVCTDPGSYLTPPSCEAAHCRWVYTTSQPNGYCTYP